MNHLQSDFEGTSIERWEIDHGIERFVKNGCEYVWIANPGKYRAACEEDDRRNRRQYMMEGQEQAYL